MNLKTLNDIARKNTPLETQEVIDLVQLCDRFPFFSLPFVLLAKHYKIKNDYRANDSLFQAALRVHDRSWLQHFIMQSRLEQISTDSVTEEHFNEITNSEPLTESQTIEIQEEIKPEIPETTSISESVQPSDNLEKSDEIIVTEVDLSEIETIDPLLETIEEDSVISSANSHDFNVEPESHFLNFREETIQKSSSYSEFESMFNREIENSLFIPGSTFEPVIVSTSETYGSGLFLPATDEESVNSTTPEPLNKSNLKFSAGYNIEDYFPTQNELLQGNDQDLSKDFFSWLNASTSVKGPENKKPTDKLIDEFIKTKPSISKPKQEFYSPEKAMKRSEILSREIATETLAKIYIQQERPEKAIQVYEQLKLKFPEKMSYFASLIQKIKTEHNL